MTRGCAYFPLRRGGPSSANDSGASRDARRHSRLVRRTGRTPMSPQMFGKDAPWPKDKIGGGGYRYVNCRLGIPAQTSAQLVAS